MTTMASTSVGMDWEETTPSPGGSASGSSLSQSEAEEESMSHSRCYYNGSSRSSIKLLNNNSDKRPNQYFYPALGPKPNSGKENPILNEGINGLNLNPSPPVGQDLSIASITTSSGSNYSLNHYTSHPQFGTSTSPKSSNSAAASLLSSKAGQHLGSPTSSAASAVSSTTATAGTASKRSKPIPPPLDLSIGASSLNPSSQSSSSSGSGSFQYPGHYYSPYYHLSSPKFNQAEKSLPLRKRWHSWSPNPNFMNCQEDFMLPLYSDSQMSASSRAGLGVGPSIGKLTLDPNGHAGPENAHSSSSGGHSLLHQASYNLSFGSLSSSYGGRPPQAGHQNGHGSSGHGNATPQSAGLQTPTPFYTPNEPSPKFMNSPVFSYSTPDTTLYQGPYSPIRTTSLYAPTSPFLNSSLNTPTFVNVTPVPTTSSGSSGSNGPSATSLTVPSTTSSGSSGAGTSSIFNTMIPSTMLSPASSQASTNSLSYEDLHEKSGSSSTHSLNNNLPTPAWNIFISGTKIRFLAAGLSSTWHMVDHISHSGTESFLGIKGDYAPLGLQVKTYVVTSSTKERVQLTLCPVGELHHPNIEVDCEPGHPFMVDKKGWSAVKPEAFGEAYGSHCNILEGGDIIVAFNPGRSSRSPPNIAHNPQNFSGVGSVATSVGNSHRMNTITNGNSSSCDLSRSSHMLPPMEDIKPCFGDIKPSYLGDIKPFPATGDVKPNYGDMKGNYSVDAKSFHEDVKPFAVPISIVPPHHSHLHHPHHYAIHHHQEMGGRSEDMHPPNSVQPSALMSAANNKKLVLGPVPKTKAKSKKNKDPNAPAASSTTGEPKGRRPMNAFLLFAKDKRPELIQQYPGKDNRSISVLLGEAWKTLEPPEKELYSKCAKDRAEEQKKMHPDCWKRKRSPSTTL